MEVKQEKTANIIPYGFNNRVHNEEQVDRIANSIKEFGFNQPIVVDESNIIIVGHGRFMAAKKLGLEKVPVVKKTDLTETQKKAYRILDNKLQNDSTWEFGNLELELNNLEDAGFDLNSYGLDDLRDLIQTDESIHEEELSYTGKIEPPIYKPTGECPKISDLYELSQHKKLIEAIEGVEEIPADVRDFLLFAAKRHVVFNYQKIAEFYAHASPQIQNLMEDSALVIIDFKKAIENSFVRLSKDLADAFEGDGDDAG